MYSLLKNGNDQAHEAILKTSVLTGRLSLGAL